MYSKLVAALALVAVIVFFAVRGEEQTPAHLPIRTETPGSTKLAAAPQLDAVTPQASSETRRIAEANQSALDPPTVTPPSATHEAIGDLVVHVVDGQGQPVGGARVVVYRGLDRAENDWLHSTSEAPGGLARFEGYLAALERLPQDARGQAKTVGLDMASPNPIRVPLPADGLPLEPPVLVVPEHGALSVRCTDRNGAPYVIETWVNLTPLLPRVDGYAGVTRGTRVGVYARGQHEVEFALIPTGTELLLEIHDMGIVRGQEVRIAPLGAGEARVIEVALGATFPHAVGRVVAADGAPLQARGFDVKFEPEGDARVYVLGENGSFALPLNRLRGTTDLFRARISLERPRSKDAPQDVEVLSGEFEARLPLESGPSGSGQIDVGEIVLRAAPVIAEGRVVNGEGAPVEAVDIALYVKFNQRADPEDFAWNFAGVNYVRTDADGHFELQGTVPPGEYALRVFSRDWIDRGALRFEAGTRGLVLVADHVRFLAGRVLLPTGAEASDFMVRAREPNATRERTAYATWTADVQPDGTFVVPGLRPEPVTLSLHRAGSAAMVAEIESLRPTLSPDELSAPLDPWDLTRTLTLLDFRAFLADGSPMGLGLVAIGRRSLLHQDGHVRALVPTQWGDEVMIVAAGHAPMSYPTREVPPRVDLVQGPRVVVTVDTPLPPIPDGWFIEADLEPEHPEWVPAEGFVDLDGRGAGDLQRLWRARVRVEAGSSRWELHAQGSGPFRPRWKITNPPRTVHDGSSDVEALTRRRKFDVTLDTSLRGVTTYQAEINVDEFRAAIERLKR